VLRGPGLGVRFWLYCGVLEETKLSDSRYRGDEKARDLMILPF
jgi:hypothetical protein